MIILANKPRSAVVLFSLCLLLTGCAPVMMGSGPMTGIDRLTDSAFITADGAELPFSSWPASSPKAIVIALHGFNDYRRFFSSTAEYLQQQQISCYAYDQRGFGASPNTGIWAGSDTYARDLAKFTSLIKAQHPGVPVYLLGESMGGAIILDAMTRSQKPEVAGIILSAPAVWGRQTMPWYQTSLLWTLSYTLPWLTLTGQGLEIMPSDNIEMLRALGRDPLVIKQTRVDALYGLTNLMDSALNSAEKLQTDTLLLYGKKDQIVPPEPTRLFIGTMLAEQPENKTIAYYDNGYHMLLRDLQAPLIWRDIAHWIFNAKSRLPSGADQNSSELVQLQNAGYSEN
ncbi:lysophospholipase [Methylomonas sp. LL1]|uniref:alpha/beta hydrolase n=1 Tax=Methylomonas sp. LL1 TaxID=2785785 RepID=UPI0018C3BFE7|nr:alpha/beta hydrolase [Methylomonas sp. LL1]QPK65132.1 lysophospholipase [Methylomonas sp. LL1]